MKKLNDLQCPQCGKVEKDVFTETFDGREIMKGPDGEVVTAICNQCGAELRKALHFNIGSNRNNTFDGKVTKDPEVADFIGMSLPIRHPITGDPAVVQIDNNFRLTAEVGGVKCFDGTGSIHTVIPPEKLN